MDNDNNYNEVWWGNQLTSLEGLQACTSLYCNNNQLTSLEGLQACTGLQTLNCGGDDHG